MQKENDKKTFKAAIYSRISTQKQVERTDYDSLKSHLDRCKHYIQAQENWELIKVYEDPAESGDKWQREKLQEMLSDVKNGEIDVVVTFKLDRVSRSVRQFHEILKIFEENGINLVAVTQGFDTSTPAGKLLRNVLIDFAQFERDMISDRVKEKRLARAKKGLWNGGTPPYGYKTENRKLAVDPEESEIIRRIFDVYKQTKSRTKVREELELAGAKTRQGKPFSKGTIEAMLKNPIYAGKLFENGELFDGQHEPIIDADLFFAVNQATPISYHKKRIRKTDKVFLLKGLVKCASHGCAMTPYFIMKKATPIHYYLCTKKRQYHKLECPVGYANAEKLENYVIQRLKEVSGQEPIFESIVNQVNLDLKSETLPYQKELEETNQRINEVSQQIENFIEAVASSGRKAIHDLLEKKVEKLQSDLAELKKRKSELAVIIASSPSKINARAVLQILKDFSSLCENLSPEEKATYLRGIIQEVAVAEEDIAIRLYGLPKPSLLTGSTNRLGWLPGTGDVRTRLKINIPYNPSILQKKKQLSTPSKRPKINVLREAERYYTLLQHEVVNSKADLARKEGVSRARITQMLNLLKLAPEIREYLSNLTDEVLIGFFTERRLRKIAILKDHRKQVREFEELRKKASSLFPIKNSLVFHDIDQ